MPGVVAALLLYKKIFNIKAVFVRFRVFEDAQLRNIFIFRAFAGILDILSSQKTAL